MFCCLHASAYVYVFRNNYGSIAPYSDSSVNFPDTDAYTCIQMHWPRFQCVITWLYLLCTWSSHMCTHAPPVPSKLWSRRVCLLVISINIRPYNYSGERPTTLHYHAKKIVKRGEHRGDDRACSATQIPVRSDTSRPHGCDSVKQHLGQHWKKTRTRK